MGFSENDPHALFEQEMGETESSVKTTVVDDGIAQQVQPDKAVGCFYTIETEGQEPFIVMVTGRPKWALDSLRRAGSKGCTPIDDPAPRWSAYVHELRKMNIPVETITEKHYGAYAGHHGRYVLNCRATPYRRNGGDNATE